MFSQRRPTSHWFYVAFFVAHSACLTNALALVIDLQFVSPGNDFPDNSVILPGTAEPIPMTTAGANTFEQVVRAAADWWERALRDDHHLTIHYGWVDMSPVGNANDVTIVDNPQRVSEGVIRLNNTQFWLFDPTPATSGEWKNFSKSDSDFGGGPLNRRREFTQYQGPLVDGVVPLDLLTVAKHEMGHLLGFSDNYDRFMDDTANDDDVDITAPRPHAGSQLPVIPNASHFPLDGQLARALMVPTIMAGIRRKQTAADILVAAEVGEYTDVVLNPHGGCVDLSGDVPHDKCSFSTDIAQQYDPDGDHKIDELTFRDFGDVRKIGGDPVTPGDSQEITFTAELSGNLTIDGQTTDLTGQNAQWHIRRTLRSISDDGNRLVYETTALDLTADLNISGLPVARLSLDPTRASVGTDIVTSLTPGFFDVESDWLLPTVLGKDTTGDGLIDLELISTTTAYLVADQFVAVFGRTDFDADGDSDVNDLNLLLIEGPLVEGATVVAGQNDHFDLNGDGILDPLDLDLWLADAASANGLGSPYKFGDANLDGVVDVSDLNLWNTGRFTSTLLWDRGDFNGDGVADVSDFNLWNTNKFTSSDAITAVPEPTAGILPIFTMLWLVAKRNRR